MENQQPLGPVMLDIQGTTLTAEDRERLLHPQCGGVILFARNYENIQQISALTADIHRLRSPALLIAVDQEGGRVQRFREGFLNLPPVRQLGEIYDKTPDIALEKAGQWGWLMAVECLAVGVDFSFAPVLDLDYGNSTVIGDRAFHSDPAIVTQLASAYIQGMQKAGMAAIGKHFPGHGYVSADSHTDLPRDDRPFDEIEQNDLQPFKHLVTHQLQGIMPAHVIYQQNDPKAAGFSQYWLQTILREKLGFKGIIFSDDLSMAAAYSAGTIDQRAQAALTAGCDMLLVCNDPAAAGLLLESLEKLPVKKTNFELIRPKYSFSWETLHNSETWMKKAATIA